jgi:excinuclease ABC subunit C
MPTDISSLDRGVAIIQKYAKTLPETPGIYRMIGTKEEALYIGKAKALKRRVVSYTRPDRLPERLRRMIAQTATMEFIQTRTEAEALLLEANLIKKHKPYFNVLLRDDKSFPYILMTGDHDFPTVLKHRGAHARKGEYFGPFAGAGDVNRVLITLQRVFMIRNCTDNYFAARTRPCLQYHIKRCTAPCVGMVTKDQYAAQAAEARAFLRGRSREIQERMVKAMESASAAMDYETAASYRDRIKALTAIQATQDISIKGITDADIFALSGAGGRTCVQVFFFRGGQNFGNRSYFPRHAPDEKPEDILGAFIAQFYQARPSAPEIILSHNPTDKDLIEEALSLKSERKVKIIHPKTGARARLMTFALENAAAALARQEAEAGRQKELLEKFAKFLGTDKTPERIEVYDNSHISGTNMVGAMIVAGPDGFQKTSYRKFNIKNAAAADDTGMMREVLLRRFGRAIKEGQTSGDSAWPDVIMIDGGLTQYNAARDVLTELEISDSVILISIAKGPDRHAGREKFFTHSKKGVTMPVNDPLLHYLQRIRDEAHRFAISTHRARRGKDMIKSGLDDMPGIGSRRKAALLRHFGSAKAVMDAGIDDLCKVSGISRPFAQKIYDYFR